MKIEWNTTDPAKAIVILSRTQLETEYPDLLKRTMLIVDDHKFGFSKVMNYQNELSGTFVIPKKSRPIQDHLSFGFILYGDTLYFIKDKGDIEGLIKSFMDQYDATMNSPFEFLLRFMNYMIQEDVYYLEDYNAKLEEIEEALYDGHSLGLERVIMIARKDMNVLGSYYLQLTAIGESLQQIIIPFNNADESAMLSLFLSRCSQLLNLVENVKDNTSQIWNLRQTQLSDKQNKISTLLTVITTLFLPLTLMTGWYGMNFPNMPLLHNKYGYLMIVCLALVVLTCEILFIRRRHWLNSDRTVSALQKKREDEDAVADFFSQDNNKPLNQ
ncbi:CorA family divalent cation transporter [Allobaculum sp. JKK-2023]|uniref:magnesium transporter CorA family protein n=1 Tax=Allobaculum sp. JKK-2023 TaxID=3108943 RepID=UPI002B05C5CD|nr:CorA family divalent cation transporter [Allobaculum sp. JKK-2023]